jgi:hypothetical protein
MKDVKATEEVFTHPKKSKKAPENMKFIPFFSVWGILDPYQNQCRSGLTTLSTIIRSLKN